MAEGISGFDFLIMTDILPQPLTCQKKYWLG